VTNLARACVNITYKEHLNIFNVYEYVIFHLVVKPTVEGRHVTHFKRLGTVYLSRYATLD
jgi:hypothetical protein